MKKAFTLVELLVVVAIMGVLTVIAVSQFRTAKKKANDVARKGDLSSVSKALQMYYADYKKFPAASSQGEIIVGSGVNTKTIKWGEEFIDQGYIYMKTMPKENTKGFPEYCYKTDEERKSFALFAKMENIEDKQCFLNEQKEMTYDCGGNTDSYCLAYVSPNVVVDDDGNLSPIGSGIIPTMVIQPTASPLPTTYQCAADGESCTKWPCCNIQSNCVGGICQQPACVPAGDYCDVFSTCCGGLSCSNNKCGGGEIDPPACVPAGAYCDASLKCCDGLNCKNSQCSSGGIELPTCIPLGGYCDTFSSKKCCDGLNCTNNRCGGGSGV
jgi:prepilin-type N-terminal cleavage/methylation domain-containing protein